jgi:hypothetical protein
VPNPSYLALSSMLGQTLYSGQLTSTAATSIYTVPASRTVKLATGTLCNTTGSNRSVSDGVTTGPLPAPTGVTATPVATGGTFTAATYFWKVTATNAAGETVGSTEASAAIVANGSATIGWTVVTNATGYRVFRATTTGGQSTSPALVGTISSGATITFTDTGAATSAGAVPAINNTGSTVVTSATANFAAADVGKTITGSGIPASTTITSVTNATTIVLSAPPTTTGAGVTLSWGFPPAAVAVTVAVLKSGDSADGTHSVVSNYLLAGGDTLSLRDYIGGAMLGEAETISVTAGKAYVVDVVLTGAVSA